MHHTHHTIVLARALTIVGVVFLVTGLLVISLVLLSAIILSSRFSSSLFLISLVPVAFGWFLIRYAGKYAVKLSAWSVGSLEISSEERNRLDFQVNPLSIALTIIGLVLLVGGLTTIIDWMYSEIFPTSSSSLFDFDDLFRYNPKDDLLTSIIQLVFGLVFIYGQQSILRWLNGLGIPEYFITESHANEGSAATDSTTSSNESI